MRLKIHRDILAAAARNFRLDCHGGGLMSSEAVCQTRRSFRRLACGSGGRVWYLTCRFAINFSYTFSAKLLSILDPELTWPPLKKILVG